ncbi:MAG: CoB--CoM heterodisulfide reductase iron-sulfur subunit A family protein [Bryobacteraceae bacterium]
MQPELKTGVYICHCGTNIAGIIDVQELAAYAASLPGVAVAREYKYMCSDPGQRLVREDIHQLHLDRVVVAAKARDLIRAAVRRVALHVPLTRRAVPINQNVVVVGGGIAGIHAALTIANSGKQVYLVERAPSIGGHMAQFDKTFPTLDCAACILTPKMTAVRTHPHITLWTLSEVTRVEGYVGNFRVTVTRKPRYVLEDACVGCMECVEACVFQQGKTLDEFNAGLSKRKPVYMPFPQAVPQIVLIDPDACIEFKSGKCKKTCIEACADRGAIDLKQEPREETIDAGAIVLATGFEVFDVKRVPYYGYGAYPNVYTALEVERLVNASGPTSGEVRLRDGRKPRTIGIVHCVGSRDINTNRYCSRVCCMYSLKLAHLLKEKTGADIYNFYIDIRAPGKGFEEFYERVAEEGVQFIRGRVADISPANGDGRLIVRAEDTLLGMIREIGVDMAVLSAGLEPRADAQAVRRLFNISCSTEGFFLERHPKLAPVNTFTDGIYLAGCCQAPKDIPDTVAQAGAAAGEALALLDAGFIELEPNTAYVDEEHCSGCKTCVAMCPYHAISMHAATGKAEVNEALCKGCGTCVAACPTASMRQHLFEDQQIFEELAGVLEYA